MDDALSSGGIDLAMGYCPNLNALGIMSEKLFLHSLFCLVRANHPQVRSSHVTLDTLLELQHAVVHSVGRSNELFETLLRTRKLRRKVTLLSSHVLSLSAIIASADLIVTVPRSLAEYYVGIDNLRMVEPPINIQPYEISQFCHGRFDGDPAVKWLRTYVANLHQEKRSRSRAASGKGARS
ncbi:LysR substrate-binding domain-containing protein [Tardiphaga alba]|nr:LysR substrate-binding domain-containing protein [Tardiphaga alba]